MEQLAGAARLDQMAMVLMVGRGWALEEWEVEGAQMAAQSAKIHYRRMAAMEVTIDWVLEAGPGLAVEPRPQELMVAVAVVVVLEHQRVALAAMELSGMHLMDAGEEAAAAHLEREDPVVYMAVVADMAAVDLVVA